MIKLSMSGKNGIKEYKLDSPKGLMTGLCILVAGIAAIYLYRTAKEIDAARIAEEESSTIPIE